MTKNSLIKTIDAWHKTVPGYLAFLVIEGLLAYGFLSLAIPSAHIWEWALAVIFGLGALHNFLLLIQRISYDVARKAERTRQD